MEPLSIAAYYADELQAEYQSTRKCLERIPNSLYDYKPHSKSMQMGYLALLVAEIPNWIVHIIKHGVVNFATYQQFKLSTTDALVEHFEHCFKDAKNTLQQAGKNDLEGDLTLQQGDTILMKTPKLESVGSAINHWVHHRGQLTVYMRLNDIAVPSIYGPSADDRSF